MKLFDLCYMGEVHKVQLKAGYYESNGNLAIQMIECEDGVPAWPWSTLTVNLGVDCPKDCAYIDVNNNGSEILSWITENGLAVPTGNVSAGYPEYCFDHKILEGIELEG